ncbi:MAG TPA: hypothetical protein DCS42_03280 [Nitrospiraceae bacterium]|nr:hypothetical protein [Nitrospiraceae bacterium]
MRNEADEDAHGSILGNQWTGMKSKEKIVQRRDTKDRAGHSPRRVVVRALFAFFVVLLMANLNALIDLKVHPDIPYFHEEHLIVGGVSGFLTALLFFLVFLYVHRLENAANEIIRLRGLLPICASCKKIRGRDDKWYPVERYVSEHSKASFTHGLCPECAEAMMEKFRKE